VEQKLCRYTSRLKNENNLTVAAKEAIKASIQKAYANQIRVMNNQRKVAASAEAATSGRAGSTEADEAAATVGSREPNETKEVY
jgi:uncharacterized protein (DUF885 family)